MEKKVYPVQSRKDLCGAWVISVNMGYGHNRAAFALKDLAESRKIIAADGYPGIPEEDLKTWESGRNLFGFGSGLRKIPLIGDALFEIQDRFIQGRSDFSDSKNLPKANFQVKQNFSLIKKGWGKHLIEELKIKNKELGKVLPIVTTFFTPAFAAEHFEYPGEIFCVICDADMSRSWVSINPAKSKIKYFAPTENVVKRLKFFGVKPENIFLTGFPLPQKLIGTESMEILKEDLRRRLLNLDPQGEFFRKYGAQARENLGVFPERSGRPLTIMFSIGGAGVQKEIGMKIIRSLAKKIQTGEVKVIIAAGIKKKVKIYFEKKLNRERFSANFGGNVEILYCEKIEDYFEEFNQKLRKTDILWTKPSELSLYTALGLPIIIAPPMGFQENCNREWLLRLGSGINQENPAYASQWLFNLLNKGLLAEAAFNGFLGAEKLGTFKIAKRIAESV